MSETEFFSGKNPYYSASNEKLATILKNTRGSQSMVVLDAKGIIVAGSNKETVGESRSDREYFQKSIKGEAFISDATVSQSTGQLIIAFSRPIKDLSGKVIGVYSSNMSSEFL